MMTQNPIITVEPVAHSRESVDTKKASSSPAYRIYETEPAAASAAAGYTPAVEYHENPNNVKTNSARPKSKAVGAAKLAAGGVCALVGIPMLVLPGPGLLALGGGAALMASGAKDLMGR